MPKPLTHRRFLALAIPNVLTNLTVPLAGLLDMAFLGHQETVLPLAGVALATIIFDYLYWSFGFLRMGTTGLTAGAFGKDDKAEQAAIFSRAIWLAIAIASLIFLLQTPIASTAFHFLHGEAAVEAEGLAYFHARIWGAIPVFCLYVCNGWLLGKQHPTAVLMVATLLNGLNILLDWWFIIEQNMGAAGAGYASAIAEWSAFLLALTLVRYHSRPLPKVPWKHLWQAAPFIAMLRLSANLMLRTFCLITTFALFTNFSAGFGTVVLAGNALLLRFLTTAAYGIDGFAFALESLAGYYDGTGNRELRKRSLTMALQWSLLATGTCLALLYWQAPFFVGLMTVHQPVIEHAIAYLPYLILLVAIAGFAYIYDGYFIGLARGDILRNTMMIALGAGFLPWIMALYFSDSPVHILWWGMISFTALRGLTLFKASRALAD